MSRAFLPLVFLLVGLSWASGQTTSGQWTYIVENGGATITGSTATGDVTIPSSLGGLPVKTVGASSRVFGINNTSVTSVTIPNSVTSIGSTAFDRCTGLTSVSIPDSVTSIGMSAFSNCTSLTSVTVPNSVTSIGVSAFYGCTSLTSVSIPNSVTYIDAGVFFGCTSLTNVTLPSSLKSIPNTAFYGCTSLTSVTVPNSVTSIGVSAFYGCTSLTSMSIPNSMTSIGVDAFSGCTSLTKVFLPSSFETTYQDFGLIASQVFFYDASAEIQWTYFIENAGAIITASTATGAVTIPSSLGGLPVRKVGNGSAPVFGVLGHEITSVTSVSIPDSVTSIGSGAFNGCTSLTNLSGLSPALAIDVRFSGVSSQAASDGLIQSLANALATNTTFITNLAEAIKSATGTYGIATQSGLSSAIEPLATKTEIATAINEGKAAGIASVTASPNSWNLFTTSQIQNMAIGDLVLTKEVDGNFVLNYEIEQSDDLRNWTPYQALSLPLTGLPTDKAFIRIRAKQ